MTTSKTVKSPESLASAGPACWAFSAPDKVDGCRWEAFGGPFGISFNGMVFDGSDSAIGDAADLSDSDRVALGTEMIRRWNDFIRGK